MSAWGTSSENQTVIPEVDTLLSATTGVLAVFGVIGNGFVLLAIATQQKLHKRANFLLFSLTLLDFFTCALSGPYSIVAYYMRRPWPSFYVCRLMLAYGSASATASCVFIALIAVHALSGIVCLKSHPTRRTVEIVALTFLGWLCFFLMPMPIVVMRIDVNFVPHLGVCYIASGSNTTVYTITIFSITGMSWVMSLMCYLLIVNAVRMSSRRIATVSAEPSTVRRDARSRHLLKLVAVVLMTLVLYIILFIPLLIVEIMFNSGLSPHYLVHRFVCMLFWCSSAFNPYIYAYRLQDIRDGITSVVRTMISRT